MKRKHFDRGKSCSMHDTALHLIDSLIRCSNKVLNKMPSLIIFGRIVVNVLTVINIIGGGKRGCQLASISSAASVCLILTFSKIELIQSQNLMNLWTYQITKSNTSSSAADFSARPNRHAFRKPSSEQTHLLQWRVAREIEHTRAVYHWWKWHLGQVRISPRATWPIRTRPCLLAGCLLDPYFWHWDSTGLRLLTRLKIEHLVDPLVKYTIRTWCDCSLLLLPKLFIRSTFSYFLPILVA